jgi:hypothetical protein
MTVDGPKAVQLLRDWMVLVLISSQIKAPVAKVTVAEAPIAKWLYTKNLHVLWPVTGL